MGEFIYCCLRNTDIKPNVFYKYNLEEEKCIGPEISARNNDEAEALANDIKVLILNESIYEATFKENAISAMADILVKNKETNL